jgi:hypothetical protein
MASAHSTSKGRSSRNRRPKARSGPPIRKRLAKQDREKTQASDRRTTMRIRGRVREFLDLEHGFLLKVESLLLCIAKSMDDGTHPPTGPYYPDVVGLACELVRRRARSFDELLLDGRLPAVPASEQVSS